MSEYEDLEQSLDESVAEGLLKHVGDRNGEKVYALTTDGEARVERLLDATIEYAATQLSEHLELPLYVCRDLIIHRAAHLKEVDA